MLRCLPHANPPLFRTAGPDGWGLKQPALQVWSKLGQTGMCLKMQCLRHVFNSFVLSEWDGPSPWMVLPHIVSTDLIHTCGSSNYWVSNFWESGKKNTNTKILLSWNYPYSRIVIGDLNNIGKTWENKCFGLHISMSKTLILCTAPFFRAERHDDWTLRQAPGKSTNYAQIVHQKVAVTVSTESRVMNREEKKKPFSFSRFGRNRTSLLCFKWNKSNERWFD